MSYGIKNFCMNVAYLCTGEPGRFVKKDSIDLKHRNLWKTRVTMRSILQNRARCNLSESASLQTRKETSDFQVFVDLNLKKSPQPDENKNVACNDDGRKKDRKMGRQKMTSGPGQNIWKIAFTLAWIYCLIFAGGTQIFDLPSAVSEAKAADTGWINVGTATNDNSFGTMAWANPGNITASDDSVSHVENTYAGSSNSNYLKGTNLGLADGDIPAGATIDGIEVRFEIRDWIDGDPSTVQSCRLVKADGSIGTTDRASDDDIPSSDAYISKGGASDLWGETLSDSDVKDSDFGFVIAVTMPEQWNEANVDNFQVKVYYSAALTPEQEGFRFRNDDGNETGATWLAAQDADISRDKNLNTRLRMLLNATADPASTQYQLEYKKSTDETWSAVGGGSSSEITLVGSTTAVVASGNGDEDIALPSGIAEGDIVLVVAACDSSLNSVGINTAGYTNIEFTDSGSPGNQVAYKIMGASPDSVVNFLQYDGKTTAVVIQVWRGVDTDNPIDQTPELATGTSLDPDSPAYTPVTSGALVFSAGMLDDDVTTLTSGPSGYTNVSYQTGSSSSGNNASAMLASKTWAGGGRPRRLEHLWRRCLACRNVCPATCRRRPADRNCGVRQYNRRGVNHGTA